MKTFVGALTTLALITTGAAFAARPAHGHRAMEQLVPSQDLPNIDVSAEESATPTLKQRGDPERSTVTLVPKKRGESAKRLSGLSFNEALKQQLPSIATQLGVKDASRLALTPSESKANALGLRVVTFKQNLDGVEIFRGNVAALFGRDNRLVATSGQARTQLGIRRSSEFAFDAAQAVSLAYADLAGQQLDAGLLVHRGQKNGYDTFTSSALTDVTHRLLSTPARAKRVFFPVKGSLIPSWYVEVELEHPTQRRPVAYSYVISATAKPGPLGRGALLLRNNLVADADLTFRVWADSTAPFTPHDGPTGTEATPYPYPAFDPDAPYGPYVAPYLVTIPRAPNTRGDVWLAEGATTTSGNNVKAYADLATPDYWSAGDLMGAVSAPDTFDYLFDPTLPPGSSATQRQAAIAQLFFTNNWLHDTFYEAGFDEAARNAQLDNYGRGGVAGDPVEAQAQDFSGTDNANMLTPADGTSPRMQMYVFNGYREVSVTATAPSEIADTYDAGYLTTGPQIFLHSGEVVRGLLAPTCDAFTNEADVTGKIVLISWKPVGCGVVDAITVAMESTATGVLMEDNRNPANPNNVPNVNSTGLLMVKPMLVISLNTAATFEGASAPAQVTMNRPAPETDLDGTVDNAIVAHEWGHYLTNRLVGNGSGLNTKQARAMGEGWGDFVALLTLVREEDAVNPNNANWTGAFPMSTYATRGFNGTWASYFGIRRIPYSTDRAKNALTFKHIDNSQTLPTTAPMLESGLENSQFHNAGEIWATTLWEVYVSLLRAHDFADAQTRMRNYFVAGLKLTPVNPTFTEARDALLAAAFANDPADHGRMIAAFASRGMGGGAVSARRNTNTNEGVIESYTVGAAPTVISAELTEDTTNRYCDRDGYVDNEEAATLTVVIRNTGWAPLSAGTLTVSSSTPGASGSVAFPALDIAEEATVELQLDPVFSTAPARLSLSLERSAPGLDEAPQPIVVHFDSNLDLGHGASVETVDLHEDSPTWNSTVTPTSANGWDYAWLDDDFPNDLLFYGPDNGVISDLRLVTPPIEVGAENFSVTFDHLFSFDSYYSGSTLVEAYDGAVIELSTDGTTWVDVGNKIASGPGYNATIQSAYGNPLGGRQAFGGESPSLAPNFALDTTTLDFGTTYANQTVRLRFRIGTDDGFGDVGWAIDNVTVTGAVTGPFYGAIADDGVCQNRPPVANAGADFAADERTSVSLAGSATDPDGTTGLTYAWTQISGPPATLTGADTATPNFTAPEVTTDTAVVFELTVSDGSLSGTDTVTVTVRNVNRAPTAFAGADGVVNEREVANLVGLGSDPDGDTVSYEWTQLAGPAAISAPVTDALLSFVAPEVTVDTDVTFLLTVTDGVLSATDEVTYTIHQVNRAPTVTTADVTVDELTAGSLAATGVDADGNSLTYSWAHVSGTNLTLVGADTATPTFTAPEVSADSTAVFEVTVSDGSLSATATATVTIRQINVAPTVSVPATLAARVAVPVTVPVTSTDHDGDTLTFTWTQTSGTATTFDVDAATGALTLTPTEAGELTYALVVSDGPLSATASVTLTAAANTVPVIALVGEDAISANEGATLELSVTTEDADSDAVGVTWTQLSGPTATLEGANTATLTVTLPQIQRISDEVVFQAVGHDGFDDSEAVTVTVTIADQGGNGDSAPTVTINPIGDVPAGRSGTLTAVGHDPQGGTLTYVWEQTGGTEVNMLPAREVLRFGTPNITEESTLTFQVTVTSSASGLSTSATVSTKLLAGSGEEDETGCGCTSANPASMLPAGLAFLALLLRRRRSVS